ncbi:MAG: hypothetical protein AAFN74_17725, partial [Myxococcota bacterium]
MSADSKLETATSRSLQRTPAPAPSIASKVSTPDPLAPRRYTDRIDVKLDHAIDTRKKKTHYKIESYFFVPYGLGLTQHTYSLNDFFSDVRSYIRFQEPAISADVLSDVNSQSSPLHRALKWIDAEKRIHCTTTRSTLSYEMRLYACIASKNLRDVTVDLKKKIQRLRPHSASSVRIDDVRYGAIALIDSAQLQCDALRSIRKVFHRKDSPRWHRELFAFVDRYL